MAPLRFSVECVDHQTGQTSIRSIEAESADDAAKIAARFGFITGQVVPDIRADPASPKPGAPSERPGNRWAALRDLDIAAMSRKTLTITVLLSVAIAYSLFWLGQTCRYWLEGTSRQSEKARASLQDLDDELEKDGMRRAREEVQTRPTREANKKAAEEKEEQRKALSDREAVSNPEAWSQKMLLRLITLKLRYLKHEASTGGADAILAGNDALLEWVDAFEARPVG